MLQLLAYTALFWIIMPLLILYVGKFILRYSGETPDSRALGSKQVNARVEGLRPTAVK